LVTAGRIPRNNGIPWRGDSGLKDGSDAKDVKGGLVGGYYDAGDNIKFHFPMAFSMTLLSWSVIEYSAKYKAVEEHDHVRELIKWGTDYLLRTFNSSASTIGHVYAQVVTNDRTSTKNRSSRIVDLDWFVLRCRWVRQRSRAGRRTTTTAGTGRRTWRTLGRPWR
jgi:hypothetical protein